MLDTIAEILLYIVVPTLSIGIIIYAFSNNKKDINKDEKYQVNVAHPSSDPLEAEKPRVWFMDF